MGRLLALLAFGGAVASVLAGLRVATVDGAAKQREYFGDAEPPLGLALASAVRLPTGDVVLRFARPAEGAAAESGLREVLVLEYASHAAVEAQLRGSGDREGQAQTLVSWEKDPSFEFTAVIERGDVEWGELRTKMLVERTFAKGGGWHEEARVDLSTPERARMLCARWPDGTPADQKVLRQVLAALRLQPPA